ncbi:HPr family phosphocarrier protein [Thalassotalea mangrovi]|uniref:HPr family phosphocarrier protein n=1 Tax=Thalassotalea mangrovi TaxID=2572245 RepID=A0A4U1BD15_9GAMM|nr:HPr family phosphocarrier protein [Thalassotalea mangrovi]TKB47885.1 HPr family phosphocarrier protein [Thalassotalea mangrovi]
MTVVQRRVTITNKLGLHARAATKLAKLTQQFSASIHLQLDDKHANADSIMALMLLTGSQGKEVLVSAEGEDARLALEAVCQLFSNRFDEPE